jgi:hypothetical protein
MIPITPADLDRFHRNAPAALARRGRGYLAESVLNGAQTVLIGGIPILGLMYWGWSGMEMLLFLIVIAWVGIVCDAAKVLWLRERAEAFARAGYDDWHVWVVADAIRSGTHKAPPDHLRARWQPMVGIFVDLVMGGVSTLLIVGQLVATTGLSLQSLQAPALLVGLTATAGFRVVYTIWQIVHHWRSSRAPEDEDRNVAPVSPDSDRPVKAIVGLRGVGLFLLMFLTMMLTEGGIGINAAWIIMLVVNGLVVLLGIAELLGPLIVWGETRWLRQYLAERPAAERARKVTGANAPA